MYFPRGALPPIHADYPWMEIESSDGVTIIAKVGSPSVRKLEDHDGAVELVGYLIPGEDGLEVANAGFKFFRPDDATPIRKPRPSPGGPRR